MSGNLPPSQGVAFKNKSTEELVQLAQQDDLRALEELVQRYQRSVYMTFYQLAPDRTDIADLTQDALLRMCRSIKSIRNPKTFKFWLNRIITNLFYDELRKTPRQLRTISMDEPMFNQDDDSDSGASRDIPDQSLHPEHLILNSELDQKIHEAIKNLPEQFRTIIVLRELQGMSYEEIASLTNSNLGTVKSRLARARLKLQEAIGPYLKGK